MRKIRYFQYTSNIYQNQAEYPVYIDLGSSDKTKQYYIVKSPDSKVKFIFEKFYYVICYVIVRLILF